jgi:hypothetical protein
VLGAPKRCAQGITLDRSRQHAKTIILLDRKRLEPTPSDMTAATTMSEILVPPVSGQQLRHPTAEIAILEGPKSPMKMLGMRL